MPWVTDPSAVPRMSPSTVGQNAPPKVTMGRTPTYTVANSKFGDDHVQNSCSGRPWRSEAGMYSMPPGSTATTAPP